MVQAVQMNPYKRASRHLEYNNQSYSRPSAWPARFVRGKQVKI
jgi:hypothetical protein